jgi:hypothetical protein
MQISYKSIVVGCFVASLLPFSVSSSVEASTVSLKKCVPLTPFKSTSRLPLVDKKFSSNLCGPGDASEFLFISKTSFVNALNSLRTSKAKAFSWDDKWLNRTVTQARLNKNFPDICQINEAALGGNVRKLVPYVVDAIRQDCFSSAFRLTLIDRVKKISAFVNVYPVEVYSASRTSSSSKLVFYVAVSWDFWE